MARERPEATSASQLVAYAMCPRLYWFRYCTAVEPEHRSTNLALGSAVHGAIGWFFEEMLEGREPTVETAERIFRADLLAEIDNANIRWKDTTPDELEAEGLRLVRVYLAKHATLPVIDVEQAFHVALADPETGEILGRPIKGYFDLVGEDRVYELKTSAKAWSEWDLPRHLQVGAYCFASHVLHDGDARVEVQTIVKLKKEPRVDSFVVERDAAGLRWWLRAASEIESAIAAGHFPPAPSPFTCRDCEYGRACAKLGLEARAAVPAPRSLRVVPPALSASL